TSWPRLKQNARGNYREGVGRGTNCAMKMKRTSVYADGSMLGRKKEAAIGALLVHRTVEDAARAVGVSSKTLQRWQKRPEFQAAYAQARRESLTQCMARLQQASSAAV